MIKKTNTLGKSVFYRVTDKCVNLCVQITIIRNNFSIEVVDLLDTT